ncbi:MAG: ATP-binding protein, partial [Chitinophagales bacterium]
LRTTMPTAYQKNAHILTTELSWLETIVNTRIQLHFDQETSYTSIEEISAPDLATYPSTYSEIIQHFGFGESERLVILLALASHISPHVLDVFFTLNPKYNRAYTQFGGVKGKAHSGFLPTIETAIFILAGKNIEKRFEAIKLFDEKHPLRRESILQLDKNPSGEPKTSAALNITEEFLSYFTSGERYKPDYSSNFPAQLIRTQMDWEDLILDEYAMDEVMEIPAWLEHKDTILHKWGMGKKIKPGYRALFYGPPGTGKTLTASLIGKSLNLDVYRIDISQVVSKYIGETEKNMANIFDQAQNKNWILFFDEADALFGKRTAASDSKDRHANQEVAYLLQRVETFPGVVILATNLKGNIDEAFARRFQSMIYFRMPNAQQRLRLWKTAFAKETPLKEDIDLFEIAQKYELAGGAIINVSRYCALSALRRGDLKIWREDILHGISREYGKEGRTM